MDTLKDTIIKLKNELEDKSKRVITLEHGMHQLRNDVDLLTTRIADNDELKTKISKYQIKNNQLEESIRAVSSRLEQIEKV